MAFFCGEYNVYQETKNKLFAENSDPTSELAIVDMIRYALEHADKYIPCKESRDWVHRSTFFVDGVKDKV